MQILPDSCLALVTFCTLLESLFVQETAATCSRDSGPSGLVECVNLYPYYQNRTQWATCLTDAYIRQKSKGQHACVDTTATYCWYQCMIETHNVEPGNIYNLSPVYDDCACGNGGAQTTQQPIQTSTLPPWCFSPDGQDCSWYKDCLEKRHPCEGTAGAYAITYANTFCKLYEVHAPKFSQTGQKWINAVRKCLQVALVPILRPWVTITCDGIREMAFNSHSGCYLSPYQGAPSICDLPAKDWWEIFWTIKSAFISNFEKSLQGVLDVLEGCGGRILDNLVDMIKLKFNILRVNLKRNKRSTSDALNEMAGDVADAIGSKLGWVDAGVMWYAYSSSSTSSNTVPVYVLITGKSTYNLNNIQGTHANLTSVKETVVKAVQNGDLSFGKIGSGSETIYVQQMKACNDFACLNTTNEVTAPEKDWTKSSASHLTSRHMQITYSFLLNLIIVALH